jgi:hypothetical protein
VSGAESPLNQEYYAKRVKANLFPFSKQQKTGSLPSNLNQHNYRSEETEPTRILATIPSNKDKEKFVRLENRKALSGK